MRKFTCDEARAHLSDALAGEIGRPEANVLEAHLLDCDPCRDLTEMFLWQDRVIAELAGQARLES
jgi:predicted anti-sigma-YlaC factor YlaD